MANSEQVLTEKMDRVEERAWGCLASFDFAGFGRWASTWVEFNKVTYARKANPFKGLVETGRKRLDSIHNRIGQSND